MADERRHDGHPNMHDVSVSVKTESWGISQMSYASRRANQEHGVCRHMRG